MESHQHMIENGQYYGYPDCCIKAFVKPYQEGTTLLWWERSKAQIEARKHGFIPCKHHAEEILQGRITIEELISPSRKCPKRFGFNSRGIPLRDHLPQTRS